MTNAEIKLTEGMTPEAFSTYRTLFSELAKGPGTSSRAARINAILFARRADNFARVISEKTGRNYTAKDYYQERFALGFNGQQQADAFNQQVVAQSEAVRKQYEGTDQWMKAPNGEPTNLTEEQWCIVRTPAFKEWFGDWENHPENASKVVDENGEPKVMYHGTPYGGFETFKDESYFTGDKEYADVYHNPSASSNRSYHDPATNAMTYEVFLNIRKPFDTRNPEVQEIFDSEFYRKWGNGAPLSESGLPDWTDATDLLEFIDENEYDFDGIILDEGGTGGYGDEVKSRGLSYVPVRPNQIKSATGNNGNFDANDANIYHQILGEKGAAALDRQEEVTTRLDNLSVARQMEEAGEDALTIKLATGWERGADKLWKYEIDDNWFALKAFPGSVAWREAFMAHQEAYSPAFYATLDEILLADDLFKAYPALKNVKVKMDELGGAYGEYTTKTEIFTGKKSESGEITLDYGIPESEVRNVLLHEVQHAIQEIEGFARGGTQEASSKIKEVLVQQIRKHQFKAPYEQEQYTENWRKINILEFVLKERKFSENPESFRKSSEYVAIGPYFGLPKNKKERRDILWEKIQEWRKGFLDELDGVDRYDYHEARSKEDADIKKEIAKCKRENDKLNPALTRAIQSEMEADKKVTKVQALSSFEVYRALAGEVESRNVERRMSMSWAERQKTLLKDTEDVAREDQIFLRNGGVSMAINVPVNETTKYPVLDLSQFKDNIGDASDTERARTSITNYIVDKLVGTNTETLSRDLMLRYGFDFGDDENVHHVAYGRATQGRGKNIVTQEHC